MSKEKAVAVVAGIVTGLYLLIKGKATTEKLPEKLTVDRIRSAKWSELDLLLAKIRSDYAAGEIDYPTYSALFVAQRRRERQLSLLKTTPDLALNEAAAQEFMSRTANIQDEQQIYDVYSEIYDKLVAAYHAVPPPTVPSPVPAGITRVTFYAVNFPSNTRFWLARWICDSVSKDSPWLPLEKPAALDVFLGKTFELYIYVTLETGSIIQYGPYSVVVFTAGPYYWAVMQADFQE